ncbi:MAG: hypothetical protein DMG05_18690, partial [Acidobacteria bacterium]
DLGIRRNWSGFRTHLIPPVLAYQNSPWRHPTEINFVPEIFIWNQQISITAGMILSNRKSGFSRRSRDATYLPSSRSKNPHRRYIGVGKNGRVETCRLVRGRSHLCWRYKKKMAPGP